MKITVKTPIKAYVEATESELVELDRQLTYTNTSVKHLIKRLHSNHFFKSRNPEGWQDKLTELQKELTKTLVFKDDEGTFIRPGSIPHLTGFDPTVENLVKYPTPRPIPWVKALPFELHPYQKDSVTKLISERHGNVSLTTGSGKASIILKLCRDLGLKTAVVAPSKAIFHELKTKLEYHLGKGKIGTFGDGKKKLGKLITVCIGDSLANIKSGSPEHEFFNSLDVLCIDESHTFSAESLEAVCHGVLENIPYRFFLSATQIRSDGTMPLLQSIIGKTVETLTTAEAVLGGFICRHEFRIVQIQSSNPSFQSRDPIDNKRQHLLRNTNIAAFAAKLANTMYTNKNEQTLILVEELGQIAMIIKLLKIPYAIAHSESSKARLEELGLEKVDVEESIEKFNKNEVGVLIGSSCIRTGCNIYPVHHLVNFYGGSSEVAVKQGAIGRAVRFGHSNPWASKCTEKLFSTIWDFDVEDQYILQHQLEKRLGCYKESNAPIKYIRFK